MKDSPVNLAKSVIHRGAKHIVSPTHILLSFLCGFLVGAGALYIYFLSLGNSGSRNRSPSPHYFETNVNELIQIQNEEDVISKRQTLIDFVWGTERVPFSELPDKVEIAIEDERYTGLENLSRIDKLSVEMEWGINSVAYHFIPIESNNQLVIYHQGHRGDFFRGLKLIRTLLSNGYSVIGMSMPLKGRNNRPVVYLERFGRLRVTSHDQIKLLPMENGHPVSFFLHPVAVIVNYAKASGYGAVYMVGISGGGWTTTLYAAIDPRIQYNYPVAGSLPIYLRSECPRDWGDYEQTIPELYGIANYVELYILGSYGGNRRQMQILNRYDPCCFSGTKYETYEDVVEARVDALGEGSFEVYLDDTHHEHQISEQAIEEILKDLEQMN
jgi:hypothetical protein